MEKQQASLHASDSQVNIMRIAFTFISYYYFASPIAAIGGDKRIGS
jgi:hypothetical protein